MHIVCNIYYEIMIFKGKWRRQKRSNQAGRATGQYCGGDRISPQLEINTESGYQGDSILCL